MQYYKSNTTGRIFTQNDVNVLNDIYGEAGVNKLIESGSFEKIEPPSVIECLKKSRFHIAVARYREINNVDLNEATTQVREIQKKLNKVKKAKKTKH